MKFLLCICFGAMLAAAQEPERATIPLSDPGRPAVVRAELMTGGITVRGSDRKDVLIEAHSRSDGEPHRAPAAAGTLRRLEMPGVAGLEAVEENNVVSIHANSMNRAVDLVISVPRRTSLHLKCLNDGNVAVDHVEGEVDADDLNGDITLTNISGSAVAHSMNGKVVTVFDAVDSSKPMSFSTFNGDIDVTFPAPTRANLSLKTDHGEIFSDFEVKLTASSGGDGESSRRKDGTFHLRLDRVLRGTLNGGGPDYQFTSFQGQIFIRKK